jgi:hypothetical protein
VSLPALPPACLLTAALDSWVVGDVSVLTAVQEALAHMVQRAAAQRPPHPTDSSWSGGRAGGDQVLSSWQQASEWGALPQSLRDQLGAHLHRAAVEAGTRHAAFNQGS